MERDLPEVEGRAILRHWPPSTGTPLCHRQFLVPSGSRTMCGARSALSAPRHRPRHGAAAVRAARPGPSIAGDQTIHVVLQPETSRARMKGPRHGNLLLFDAAKRSRMLHLWEAINRHTLVYQEAKKRRMIQDRKSVV